MDHEAKLAHPVAVVFGHLAAPPRLADWLPEVAAVTGGGGEPAGIGVTFGLRLCRGGQETTGTGELIAYEPPWYVAYRLLAGPHTHVLRVTCTASGGATRVQVHQADSAAPLAVDLAGLPEHLPGTTTGP
jgi:uncharacterized protein YndB with AHSA1/START domain